FWEHPMFPRPTLPRGRAHAAFRDHLESGRAGEAWAYLIPPPAYQPHGPARGHWQATAPSTDESVFTTHAISYADLGRAVAAVALGDQTGTRLIARPRWSPKNREGRTAARGAPPGWGSEPPLHHGVADGARNRAFLDHQQVLYQLSYSHHVASATDTAALVYGARARGRERVSRTSHRSDWTRTPRRS